MTDSISLAPMHEQTLAAIPERESFWSRIAQEMATAIGEGIYRPGERLPSEHVLAQQFGVNRHTIRRSLADLGQRGLVRSTKGLGTFVENFAVDLVLGKRTRHRQSLAQVGMRGGLRVLKTQVVKVENDVAQALQLPVGQSVLWMQTQGEGDGHILHVSERYFPLPRFAGLAEGVQASGSITVALAEQGVIDYLRQESRISARMPTADMAQWLGQPANRPVLQVTSVNIDTHLKPIEYARTCFAGDLVTLTVSHHD